MYIDQLINIWKKEPSIIENITYLTELPVRKINTTPIPDDLHPDITKVLKDNNIHSIFIHQQKAFTCINESKNIIIATGTSSGKTLCYNLPILNKILKVPATRALYIFPTKALAQDQINFLSKFVLDINKINQEKAINSHELFSEIKVGIYDGDTPNSHRRKIRDTANIIFTNPDMLHLGILPHHTEWKSFFENLNYIVIDEVHTYRGVFGSHLANVIRRLKRIQKFYSSSARFILTSATISNSVEFSKKLIGEDIKLIDDDGSPNGRKYFLIYNPPIINKELGLRKSAYQECIRLVQDLITYKINTIIFTRSRPSVEYLLSSLKVEFSSNLEDNSQMIRGYRSGYLPQQRRDIEQNLREGTTEVVVATNALELGIDIGKIQASISVGYPGTISSLWQQAGRSGRGQSSSIFIFIATADPVDQFLSHHPEYLINRSPETAQINPDNLLILYDHIRCASFELPFQSGSEFGSLSYEKFNEILKFLVNQRYLYYSQNKYFWMAEKYPAQMVSLRNTSPTTIILQVDETEFQQPRIIGQIDYDSSLWMVHPEAIYIHESQPYLVLQLDLQHKIAHLKTITLDYYTEPIRDLDLTILDVLKKKNSKYYDSGFGEIKVTTQVIGYRKIQWQTNQRIGNYELDLPLTELITVGYWIILKANLIDELRNQGLWNNDPNEYGPGWEKLREFVRRRDNFMCQICGTKEADRAHDIHHKVPFKNFHSHEQANNLDNLISLCHDCHQKVENNLRIRSGLSGFAYVVGHLAPLHLMCDYRDIGIYYDPQSILAEGNPILIIYDSFPAGIGLCENLINIENMVFQQSYELISSCDCDDGCPSCTGPGGENGSGSKEETIAILKYIRSYETPLR